MNKKIFLLDDDENTCLLVEKVLKKAGYQVMTKSRAIGATAAVKSFQPDLVLLDVMMPALSGDNLVEIMEKILSPRPKIVYYSNKSAQELKELSKKTGADGYICKIDGPAVLLQTIRSLLDVR